MKFIFYVCYYQFLLVIGVSTEQYIKWNNKEPLEKLTAGSPTVEQTRRYRRDVPINAMDNNLDDAKAKITRELEKKIDIYDYPLKEDQRIDLQMVWLGEDHEVELLLTTLEWRMGFMQFIKPSILYQSTDRGRTFQNIQDRINKTHIRKTFGISKNPHNNNKLILVSYTSQNFLSSMLSKSKNTELVITKDAGATFSKVELPFIMRENEPIRFHPWKEDWIIALELQKTVISGFFKKQKNYGQAWISKDFGTTWKPMMKNYIAKEVKWGGTKGNEDDIYLSAEAPSESKKFSLWSLFQPRTKLTLWKSSDGGNFFEEIVEDVYNFGVKENFIFASVDFQEKDGSKSKEKRILHVSSDNGVNFHPVHVPEITHDMFYAVLDIYKGALFLHKDNPGDTGKGVLYISGSDGIMFTKSLADHFHTDTGYTDFVRVESMRGVYLTQVLQADQTLTTVITFDRGLTWQPLYIDKEYCQKKDAEKACTLHLHIRYSASKGVAAQAPLASENAPGIILAHGQAGDALTGKTNVWLSTNGGYNWTRVAEGAHHYSIGDSGNLLVLVPRYNTTGKKLLYSIDQGRYWHSLKFEQFNEDLTILGLATEPHSKERMFSLWGHVATKDHKFKEWSAITVNFHGLFSKQCHAEDFEEWSEHKLNGKGGCFLGEKITYQRPIESTLCFLGKTYKAELKRETCTCTNEDIECDYGYERTDLGKCKRNVNIPLLEVCINGKEEKEQFSRGYRRMPGDVCKSSDATTDKVKYIDEGTKCKPVKKENVYGIIKEEKKLEETEGDTDEIIKNTVHEKPHKKSSKAWMWISFFVVIAIVVASVFWYKKYYATRSYKDIPYTQHNLESPLDAQVNSGFDSRPKTHREFHDEETDAEDDILLPV